MQVVHVFQLTFLSNAAQRLITAFCRVNQKYKINKISLFLYFEVLLKKKISGKKFLAYPVGILIHVSQNYRIVNNHLFHIFLFRRNVLKKCYLISALCI